MCLFSYFIFQEGIFEIGGLNGKIKLKKPLDFEGSSSYYYLNITATVRTNLALRTFLSLLDYHDPHTRYK